MHQNATCRTLTWNHRGHKCKVKFVFAAVWSVCSAVSDRTSLQRKCDKWLAPLFCAAWNEISLKYGQQRHPATEEHNNTSVAGVGVWFNQQQIVWMRFLFRDFTFTSVAIPGTHKLLWWVLSSTVPITYLLCYRVTLSLCEYEFLI